MSTLAEKYTAEQFRELLPDMDEATNRDLYTFFQYRELKDNSQFFFWQVWRIYGEQYNRQLRDESVNYDAMVTEYLERETRGKTDGTETGNNSGTVSKTGENNETHGRDTNSTRNTARDINTTETTEGNSTDSGQNDGHTTETTEGKEISKTNPMAVSYGTTTPGTIPALDWASADGQRQTLTDTTGTTSDTTSNTHKEDENTTNKGTITDSENGGETMTGTDHADTKEHQDTSSSSSISRSENRRDRERETGRHGYSPAELLEKSRSYILKTKSFQWLCERFNNCFKWEVDL